jgi:hypothetical protein
MFLGGTIVSLRSKIDNWQKIKHESLNGTLCFFVRNWKICYLGLENQNSLKEANRVLFLFDLVNLVFKIFKSLLVCRT